MKIVEHVLPNGDVEYVGKRAIGTAPDIKHGYAAPTLNNTFGVAPLNDLCKQAHETALEKGWYTRDRDIPELIALMHSELSEALEEFRDGREPTEVYYRDDGKPEGIPIEFADLLVRVFDACGYYGIDLQAAVDEKMRFNKTRPVRHGGKKC